MNFSQEKMLDRAYSVWVVFRHIGFWLRWVFLVLFVGPSVMFCAALALYSDFSFSRIPQDILQFAAESTKYPVAQDGFLSVQACLDPKPAETSASLPKPVSCQKRGIQQRSIAAMAQESGRMFELLYAVAVVLTLGLILMFDAFGSSRRTFSASLSVSAPAVAVVVGQNHSIGSK